MAELLKEFESEIEGITLIPSDEGRFELEVNGSLVYSKLETGRHMDAGEAAALLRQYIQDGNNE